MPGSLEIPFAIGQQVWWIGNGHREQLVTCPECAGTKAITMILGNGEQVSLYCENCRLGYDPPTGQVKRTYYEHSPTRFTPLRVGVDGSEIRYSESGPDSTCYSSAYAKDLFATQEECQVRCDVLNAEKTQEETDRAWQVLLQNRKKMASSVGYWSQMVGRLRKELAATEARLAVVKAKKGEA